MADPLSISASIAGLISLADTVFRYVFKYARGAAGAREEVQSLSNEINHLSAVLRSLNALSSELEAEGQGFEPALKLEHLITCQQLFEKIKRRIKKVADSFDKRPSWEGLPRQLKWPFSATETKSLLADISRCKETLTLAASADTMRTLQLCLTKHAENNGKLDKAIEKIDRVEIHTQILVDQKKRLVLDFFLKPETNPQPSLAHNIKLRYPTTGGWLLSSHTFTHWLNTCGSRLWLSGIAGGGKTILAGAITHEALSRSSVHVGVSFFFCDYQNEATLTIVNILGAIASQLARQRDDAYQLLEDYYAELHPARALNRTADADELKALIASMCELFHQVFIIVDGMDECGDNTNSVVDALSELAKITDSTSIALASRDDIEIRGLLEQEFKEISIEAHTEDLELYVRVEMERRIRNGRLQIQNLDFKDEISEQLVSLANGMFRWVVCQLDYLEECATDADRRRALMELPPTLPGTYQRLLERLNRRPLRIRKMVQICLQFIAHFPRKLTIQQLREAISTPWDANSYLDETNTISERDIILGCSSLIRKSADGECFEFAHFSVREFLEDEALSLTPGLAMYQVSKSGSYQLLATQCVKYLQLKNFDRRPSDSDEWNGYRQTRDESHPFYYLAASTWPMLAREGLNTTSLLESVKSLFHPSKSCYFLSWTECLLFTIIKSSYDRKDSDQRRRDATAWSLDDTLRPLHIASALNMPEICEFLVNEGGDINSKCSLGTPLLLAAISFMGLIEQTHGFTGPNLSFFTDYLPIADRRNKTIELLIILGADTGRLAGLKKDHSIFIRAASIDYNLGCFVPTMKLIAHGILPKIRDIDALNEYVENRSRSDDVSKLEFPLLQFIRYLNRSSAYDTDWGLKLGKMLWSQALKMGFSFTRDPTITDSRISLSDDALLQKTFTAIYNDDTATLQLCLEDGRVDVIANWKHPRTQYRGTLLHHAISYDSQLCVNLLLKLGSDANSKDERGRVAVHVCDGSGDGTMLKVLHKHNVDFSVQDSRGATLWHYCAILDDLDVRFLDVLFHINPEATQKAVLTKAHDGHTPLTLALNNIIRVEKMFYERKDRALLYVSYCDELEQFWNKHDSIWAHVFASGSTEILKGILRTGCRPPDIEEGDITPLHELRAKSSTEWVNLLKSLYPNAHKRRFNGRLPLELYLEAALSRGVNPDENVIEALLFDDIFISTDGDLTTPWRFMCNLVGQGDNRNLASEPLLNEHGERDGVFSTLLNLKAMEGYESRRQDCGLNPLFSVLVGDFEGIPKTKIPISGQTLTRAIQLSGHWNPENDLVVRFLKMAIVQENGGVVRALVQNGVDVHRRVDGLTPIEEACRGPLVEQLCLGDKEILKCLLDHSSPEGLREFPPDMDGPGILHRTASPSETPSDGFKWLLSLLVEKGADLNAINPNANTEWRVTPLVYHIRKGSYSCAEHLLFLGADPNLTGGDDGRFDAAAAAVVRGSTYFLNVLLEFSKKNSIQVKWDRTFHIIFELRGVKELVGGVTNLHRASYYGNLGCVQFFLENNLIKVNQPTVTGINALYCAVSTNSLSTVKYLVSRGASITYTTNHGDTALYVASRLGYLDVAKALIGGLKLSTREVAQLRVMAATAGHWNVVHYFDEMFTGSDNISHETAVSAQKLRIPLRQLEDAIRANSLRECMTLVARGCPLNSSLSRCHGCSALIYAMLHNRVEIAGWMLRNGASVQVFPCYRHNPFGYHIVDFAAQRPSLLPILPAVLHQFLAEGGDFIGGGEAPLHAAVHGDNQVGLRFVLEFLSQNANEVGKQHRLSVEEVLRRLINRRLIWNREVSHGELAPLHLAVMRNDMVSTKLLLDKGADIDCLSSMGLCALDYAIGSIAMIKFLLQSGASPIPIYTSSLTILLSKWQPFFMERMSVYIADGLGELSISASSLIDSSAPSHICIAPPDVSVENWKSVYALESLGISLPDYRVGDGSLMNQLLRSRDGQSFFLNSPRLLTSLHPFPWHWTGRWNWFDVPFLSTSFRQFRRRLSHQTFRRWMNLEPDRGWSPLCRAASRNCTDIMVNCLSMGTDVNFEGCPLGSALMVASACGCTEAVKLLIHEGAAVSYSGRNGWTNALSITRSKEVKEFLLVGRFKDQPRIEAADQGCEIQEGQTGAWSGIVQARINRISHLKSLPHESMLDYCKRLAITRRYLRGKVAPHIDGLELK